MTNKYFINGWREGKNYFMRSGRFSEEELDKLSNGETITKNGNAYRIETEL